MTVIRVEFSMEDYIINDWLEVNNLMDEDLDVIIYDFVDEYFATTPDHVEIL